MGEAERKREQALAAAAAAGLTAAVATTPATVRWLLCGRGRPVNSSAPEAGYALVLAYGRAYALFQDIEEPRVRREERLEELGWEPVPYPWHGQLAEWLARLVNGGTPLAGEARERAVAPARRLLTEPERERYRAAGAAAAEAMVETIHRLASVHSEREAAAELARQAHRRGFTTPVVLVAGDERQRVHRHPLPTDGLLGRHALLALTGEREGLHVSLTRLVSFGPPPPELAYLAEVAAGIDADVLRATRPGRTLGDVFSDLERAYEERGFPEEWRLHHQGGLTGYSGREVFAVPGDPTPVPQSGAVAWNPSITGGAKSEDTALVDPDGVEVITRTPELTELDAGGIPRPAIVEL